MKNITLAIDGDVLVKVRRLAAAKDTTVNGLVRDYLTRLVEQDDRAKKARERLAALAKGSRWNPGPDWKWNREDLNDRPVLLGHQRADLRGDKSAGGRAKKSPSR